MRNKDEKAKEVVTDSRCAEANRLTHLITVAILADNCFSQAAPIQQNLWYQTHNRLGKNYT
ncbi:hypothetical protein PGH45_11140 [Legionella pneumophila]|nr:hypothetical protein [Legionella pneumophila]